MEDKTYIVYKVTSPNGKCYIGITSFTLEYRKNRHYTEMKSHNTNYKFHNAIRKYGELLKWEVLDISAKTFDELKELEKYYILYFDSKNNGYNSTDGGDGILGYKHSEETKNKMRGKRPQTSLKLKGVSKSEEHKRNLSISRKNLNIKLTEEQKKKISKSISKRNSSIDIRNIAALKGGGKSFKVYKADTKELVGEWISQRQCARDLNLNQSHIGHCLRKYNTCKTHKGYIFVYSKDVEK